MRASRVLGLALASSLLLVNPSTALDEESFPPGVLTPAPELVVPLAYPDRPPFRVDDAGHVYWINSWGRIEKDGASTNWYPDSDKPFFLLSPGGDVVYQNSYSRICKNGASIGASFFRDFDFRVDDAGRVYWVKDFTGEEIYRNSYGTGYEIKDGSTFDVDGDGTVSYRDEDEGTLFIDGEKAPVNLVPGSFVRDRRGDFYYTVYVRPNRWRLIAYRVRTEEYEFLTILTRRGHLKKDDQRNVWWSSYSQEIFKNGHSTGLRGFGFELDAAGNVYTRRQGQIWKNGEATGFEAEGHYAVTPSGDVFHLVDKEDGELYLNGSKLPFEID